LQDWLARIAVWMHEKESASFSSARYPSNAPSPIMLLLDRAIAVIESLSEA
jgi:hypothetical protein